jgi:ppGpp synthetase/RelA/SpoT-type nucleotidyltranferase
MDSEFSRELEQHVGTRVIQSISVQQDGETALKPILSQLANVVGYRPGLYPRTIKSIPRAMRKAMEVYERDSYLTARQVADRITDFAGGRLLVIGLHDVRLAHDFVCSCLGGYGIPLRIAGDGDICLDPPKASGWRGLKQPLKMQAQGQEFPYELQIMTYLQHSWDQLEHRLYEIARAGGEPPTHLREEFLKLSDELYKMDVSLDEVKRRLNLS